MGCRVRDNARTDSGYVLLSRKLLALGKIPQTMRGPQALRDLFHRSHANLKCDSYTPCRVGFPLPVPLSRRVNYLVPLLFYSHNPARLLFPSVACMPILENRICRQIQVCMPVLVYKREWSTDALPEIALIPSITRIHNWAYFHSMDCRFEDTGQLINCIWHDTWLGHWQNIWTF